MHAFSYRFLRFHLPSVNFSERVEPTDAFLCNVAAGGGKVALFVGGGFNIGNGSPLIISNL